MSRYAALLSAALAEAAPGRIDARHVRLGLPRGLLRRVPAPLRSMVHHLWAVTAAVTRGRQAPADVVHLVDGSHAYLLWLLPRPRVATVHDLIPLLQMRGTLGGRPPSRLARRLIAASVRALGSADGIVADSRATAEDLKRHASVEEGRVEVVPLAPVAAFTDGPPWAPSSAEATRAILHVGNDAFYKNREGVIRVFARIKPSRRLRLIMVGPPPDGGLKRLIAQYALSPDIEWRQDVTDGALADLYRRAALLLFPSAYEGFGWPVLEAMAMGCPVVCSEALTDLAGDGALVAPASDDAALAAACASILDDAALAVDLSQRARERASVFTRVRLGTALIGCYEAARGRRLATA